MPEYFFDHIHLRSLNPLKTAEFYTQNFGAKLVSSRDNGDGRASAKLDLSGVTILIAQSKEGDPIGLHHFGIRTGKLEESVDAMKKKGIKFTQDVRQIRPDFKMSFLEAPDNVSIELQEGQF